MDTRPGRIEEVSRLGMIVGSGKMVAVAHVRWERSQTDLALRYIVFDRIDPVLLMSMVDETGCCSLLGPDLPIFSFIERGFLLRQTWSLSNPNSELSVV